MEDARAEMPKLLSTPEACSAEVSAPSQIPSGRLTRPYRADCPQRYAGNYPAYVARGGMVRPDEDVQGFVAGDHNRGDMARFYFFSLAFDQIVKEGLIGDVVELGVYKGHTASLLAIMARRLRRTAYLLDTFEGFSAGDLRGIDAGAKAGSFSDTSLEEVRALVGEQNVRFIKGYFPATASQLPQDGVFCLVHIDCDLYAPITEALKYFYPRLVPGGFLIVHDYSSLHWKGAEKAVDQFFSDKPEAIVPLTDGAGSGVIRKATTPDRHANWLLRKQCSLLSEAWVSAGNGRIAEALGVGWSGPEPWGVWGVGDVHEVHLAVPAASEPEVELQFDVHCSLLGSRQLQFVDVIVDGKKLASWDFTPDRNRGMRNVRIEVPQVRKPELVSIHVKFRPRFVERPCDLDPAAKETRYIGMALHRLRRRPHGQTA